MSTKKNNLPPAELLAIGKWTLFLKSLPLGEMAWRVDNYHDFISLRVTASKLSQDPAFPNRFSIWEDKDNATIFHIKVSAKE